MHHEADLIHVPGEHDLHTAVLQDPAITPATVPHDNVTTVHRQMD
jgi:hypothetical protein